MNCHHDSRRLRLWLLPLIAILLLCGCASTPKHYPTGQSTPRSILVLPPTNQSPEVNASTIFLSKLTIPISEAGYYVLPVFMTQQYFWQNGVREPYEIHQIPLDKLTKVFGADAVLYLNITRFGQEYVVLSSNTVISVEARLVDSRSGHVLWTETVSHVESSGDGGGGIAGMAMAALVEQVLDNLSHRYDEVAAQAARTLFFQGPQRLPPGPYRPIAPSK